MQWALPKGSLITINGLPYVLEENTVVRGFAEPVFESMFTPGPDSAAGEPVEEKPAEAG